MHIDRYQRGDLTTRFEAVIGTIVQPVGIILLTEFAIVSTDFLLKRVKAIFKMIESAVIRYKDGNMSDEERRLWKFFVIIPIIATIIISTFMVMRPKSAREIRMDCYKQLRNDGKPYAECLIENGLYYK